MENNVYFTQLANHLYGLNDEERDDVIDFYREYASDANLSGQALIDEFGTPKQLARRVLVDYSIRYDDVAAQEAPKADETEARRNKRRVSRELNLLWVVLIGLVTSPVWIPAIFAILFGLFMVIVVAVIVVMVLVLLLVTGLFQVVGGIAVMTRNWATGLFQGGIGLMLIGLQFIAWPIGLAIVRVVFSGLMNFVKFIGRKFSRRAKGGRKNA